MTGRERALDLIGRIYDGVVELDAWQLFLEALSKELGGAAIQLSLRQPHELPSPELLFRVGLDERYHPAFVKHVLQGLPWGPLDQDVFRGRFASAEEGAIEPLEQSAFWREFMKPQGLAPEWPLCHAISFDEERPVAGMGIYRREGGRPFDADDLALLDSLVPHLARAYVIHSQLRNVRNQQYALTEVIDRLSQGVILVDATGRVVLSNRSAAQILERRDGLLLERSRLCAGSSREDRTLQSLIQVAVHERARQGSTTVEVMTVSRPSGARPFPVMVGPLLAARPDQAIDDAAAVVFVADPEGINVGTAGVLETLYGLTGAEADLVRLMSEGRSLDQVAAARGVTMNTVRSQLKQVFSKTDTSRQGELVALVLSGIASLRDSDKRPDEASEARSEP